LTVCLVVTIQHYIMSQKSKELTDNVTKGLYFGLAQWTTEQVSGHSEPKYYTLPLIVILLEVTEHRATINECQKINTVCGTFFISTSVTASYQ